jgi:hypothetical protein
MGHGEYEYVRENGRGQWVRREEATRQKAEALYATLQLGASFNRIGFERQIAAMGGRVEHFGNYALYDRRRNEAHWWGESRLNVTVVSQGGDMDYYTDFFTPYPGFVHENPGKGLGVVSSYVVHVEDGIVIRKAVWNGGGWVDFR